MSYFECNLPTDIPAYYEPALRGRIYETAVRVRARTEKLNEALNLCQACLNIDNKTFSAIAKMVFDMDDNFDALTVDDLANSVMAIFEAGAFDKKVLSQPERLEWPNAVVLFDTAFTRTAEWEELRRLSIGGSEAAIVKGISPYRTQRELYHDKRGTPMQDSKDSSAAIFERGHFLEDRVVETFCKLTGATVIPESRMFVSKTHPHCTANPDAIIRMADGKVFVYEAKTTKAENRRAWLDNQIPVQYVPQTQQYPAVLADDRVCGTYIGCLFTVDYTLGDAYIGSTFDGSKFISHRVDRDTDAEAALLDMEERFWTRYIEAEVEPEASNLTLHDSDTKRDVDLARRISSPGDTLDPTVLELDEKTFAEKARAYLALKEEQSRLDKRVNEIKDMLSDLSLAFIPALGQNIEGRLPYDDGQYIEVKYGQRKGRSSVDMELLQGVFPEAYTACVTQGEGSRTFSIKVKKEKKKK